MSTVQWILNVSLLAWVLIRNLGTHRVTRSSLLVPLALVVIVGGWVLRDIPTAGNDVNLDLVGIAAGLVLGTLAALATRINRREHHLVVRAGPAFGAVWITAIGGRMIFAQWATHGGAQTIGEFSMRHQITGAAGWTAAFVLMALTMVVVRVVAIAIQIFPYRSPSTPVGQTGAA